MSLNPLSIFHRKKVLFFIIIIFFIIIAFISSFYFLNSDKELATLEKEGSKIATQYPEYISKERVTDNFKILKNKRKSEKERYSALSNLAFFFGSGYSDSNNPYLRSYVTKLGKYAQEKYPKLYEKASYNIICQDPTCGPKMPAEITKIIEKINNSNAFTEEDKPFIVKNLQNASYIEESDSEAKFYFYLQTYIQLSNQSKEATSSSIASIADDIKAYLKTKYPKESEGL